MNSKTNKNNEIEYILKTRGRQRNYYIREKCAKRQTRECNAHGTRMVDTRLAKTRKRFQLFINVTKC